MNLSNILSNLNIDYYYPGRDANPDNGGNRHNYGIEWTEDEIGNRIWTKFLNEIDDYSVHKEYAFTTDNSWEKDFKDYLIGGLDDYYTDNVDLSIYMGHGNGGGISFENNNDDELLSYNDASLGAAMGNRDCEFQAWLSCQVLTETFDNLLWWERWGPAFNGLHLICGYQTNAGTGSNNKLKFFARNLYKHEQTVMNSWFNAAIDDQTSSRQPVVMGPLVSSSDSSKFNSVSSSINGLYRAHWHDNVRNSIGNGLGEDIPKSDVKGWWRVVINVGDYQHWYGNNSTNFGTNSGSFGSESIAVGFDSFVYKELGTAIGSNAICSGRSGISLGVNTICSESGAIAIGDSSEATALTSFAMGYHSKATGKHSIAIGDEANTSGQTGFAMGYKSTVIGDHSVAIGDKAISTGKTAFALGFSSNCSGDNSISIGDSSSSNANYSVSIGYQSKVTGRSGVAIGDNAKSSHEHSVAIGTGSETTKNWEISLGSKRSIINIQGNLKIGEKEYTAEKFNELLDKLDSLK